MSRNLLFILGFIVVLFSCQDEQKPKSTGDPVLEKIAGKDYAELIKIPTTSDGKVDTNQMARIRFETLVYNFDTLLQGDRVEHIFLFRNEGVQDLYVLQTNSSCGCTVPEYSRDPVPPGGTGNIRVVFNSSGKLGDQNRKITVITNAHPAETTLRMTGYVNK